MIDKKEEIRRCAHELFAEKGFKETSIADIMARADLAVGSFYRHFDSKEAVFLEAYIRENRALKERLFSAFQLSESGAEGSQAVRDPAEMIGAMIAMNAREMASNRILREWYNKDVMAKLERMFAESGEMEALLAETEGGQRAMIREWKALGLVREDIGDDMLLGIFRALPFLDLHKEDIGTDLFPELLIELSKIVMRGLRPDEGGSE